MGQMGAGGRSVKDALEEGFRKKKLFDNSMNPLYLPNCPRNYKRKKINTQDSKVICILVVVTHDSKLEQLGWNLLYKRNSSQWWHKTKFGILSNTLWWSDLAEVNYLIFFPPLTKKISSCSILLGKIAAGWHWNLASIHQNNIKKIWETKALIKWIALTTWSNYVVPQVYQHAFYS